MKTTPDFDEWVAARGLALLRLAYVLTGSREDAEDVVQDALSRALPRWSRISGLADPDAYVRRMVVNANVSRWRRNRKRETPRPVPDGALVITGIAIEDHDALWRACQRLPDDQRTAIVLRYYEDLDYTEIATLTGVREGSVRSRVSRGIAALRAELGETMTDFEDRLRDTLSTRAEDAQESADLARGARDRLRRRRTAIARVVAGATSVVVVSVGIALVGAAIGGDADKPAPTPDVEVPTIARDPVAREVSSPDDHLQEVTWHEISLSVPVKWKRGATTAWCTGGKDPATQQPLITMPDEPVPRIACTPSSGYGLTIGSAAAFDPAYESGHVWRYDTEGLDGRALYPDGAWLSYWYDDQWVVTVATPDPGLTTRIALSIRGAEVDANGCALEYDEVAVRTTAGPRGVGAALCRYSFDGRLEDSNRLTIREVEAALSAIAAAPALPPGDHCVQQQGWIVTLTPAGQPAYLALYGTEGLGSCPEGLQSTALGQTPGGYREVTPDLVTALGLEGLPVG